MIFLVILIPLAILSFISIGALTDAVAKEAPVPDNLAGAFTEGNFSGTIRSLLFARDYDGSTNDRSTLAIGGNLKYETAPFYKFRVGLGAKTGQGYTLNNDEVYRDVLAIGDTNFDAEGYLAMDEYYLSYSHWNTRLTLGAQEVETPWLRAHDIRMTPKKYRGVGVINNSIDGLALHGYFITDWLTWTAESWETISSGITGNADEDEDAVIIGGVWKIPEVMTLQAWNYYFNEVLNNFYLIGDYTRSFTDDYALSANLRYLNQVDVGEALGGEFSTYTVGGNVGIAAYGVKLTWFYGKNGKNVLRAPFGGGWAVSMQVNNLERANEEAWALQLDYDFKSVGLPGLSTYLIYSSFNTPDTGVYTSPDFTETNLNLQYSFSGSFENCSIRFRFALIDQDEDVEGGKNYSDGRLYLQYKF